MSEADKHRAMVLERCRKGRDEANRLGLFIKEKGDSMVRHLVMTGDLQQTLEGSLEKMHRSLRYLDKQALGWERWYVLASTTNDETESSQVRIGSGKFSELKYEGCWKTERPYHDFLCKDTSVVDPSWSGAPSGVA